MNFCRKAELAQFITNFQMHHSVKGLADVNLYCHNRFRVLKFTHDLINDFYQGGFGRASLSEAKLIIKEGFELCLVENRVYKAPGDNSFKNSHESTSDGDWPEITYTLAC